MDAFGHVNNVVFLRYLEEARIDFMFRLAPGDGCAVVLGRVRRGPPRDRLQAAAGPPARAGDHRVVGDEDRRGVADDRATRSRTPDARSTCGPRRSSCRSTSRRSGRAGSPPRSRRFLEEYLDDDAADGASTRTPSRHDGRCTSPTRGRRRISPPSSAGCSTTTAPPRSASRRRGGALAVFGRPPSFEVLAIRTARLAEPYETARRRST